MKVNKLRSKMVEQGYSQKALAEAIEISEHSLCNRFTEKTDFTVEEVKKICNVLNINDDEAISIFFN